MPSGDKHSGRKLAPDMHMSLVPGKPFQSAVDSVLARPDTMSLVLSEVFRGVMKGRETMGVLIHELSVETR
jgi:hypothetical protein